MLKAPIPPDEPQRMQALREYRILDTLPEAVYDDIAHVAAGVCDTPIALIALIDGTRNWFKARIGVEEELTESPRDISFCGHAILGDQIFEVTDAITADRFADNPLVAPVGAPPPAPAPPRPQRPQPPALPSRLGPGGAGGLGGREAGPRGGPP